MARENWQWLNEKIPVAILQMSNGYFLKVLRSSQFSKVSPYLICKSAMAMAERKDSSNHIANVEWLFLEGAKK